MVIHRIYLGIPRRSEEGQKFLTNNSTQSHLVVVRTSRNEQTNKRAQAGRDDSGASAGGAALTGLSREAHAAGRGTHAGCSPRWGRRQAGRDVPTRSQCVLILP